jgi:hypothetical protein
MPDEVPFDQLRVGGYNNLQSVPLANKGYLLPFIMPLTDQKTATAEFIIQVDENLKDISTTAVTNFLEFDAYGFLNKGEKDIYTVIGSTLPCGLYYYQVQLGAKKYKTAVFRIDNLIDKTGAPGDLPVVPKLLGDYSDDFNEDFYI